MKAIMYTFATFTTIAVLSPLTMPARADQDADRASLAGSWVQSGGSDAWIISPTTDGIHLTQIDGSDTVADFKCNLDGQNCDVKVGGHKATVSMYYNGAMLIELETRGSDVVKRRFSAATPGTAMKVEVIPMTGKGQTQDLEFHRGQPPAPKK